MKHIRFFIAIAAIFSLVMFASCKHESSSDNSGDPTTYTVTFNKNHTDTTGYTEASPETKTVVATAAVGTLPTEPTRADWEFVEWNTQADGYGDHFYADTPITADITVYAQWESTTDGYISVRINATGKMGNDSVTISPAGGLDEETVTITYTLDSAAANNRLTFSGTATAITQVDSVGSGTRTYTISEDDATDGIITINAVFTHTDLQLDTIAFANSNNESKIYGDTPFTRVITDTGAGSGAISYASGNTTVATVNSSTGEVTILGAGNATITAVKASDGTYAEAEAVYTLNVAHRQLTINTPTVTTTRQYNGTTVAAVVIGILTNKVGNDDVQVSGNANYNSPNVADANLITVVYEITGESARYYSAPLNYTIAGTITKANGGALASAPTAASKTSATITVNAISVPTTGQTVEYAIGSTNTAPTSTWQTGRSFSGLEQETTYYIFARSKEDSNYFAGTAVSAAITTSAPSNIPRNTVIDFEDANGPYTTGTVQGANPPTVSIVADPITAGEKSFSITASAYNQGGTVRFNLPYELKNYETISFRHNLTAGTVSGNISVYVASGTGAFKQYGFGNPAGGSNPEFAAYLAGEKGVDLAAGDRNKWTNYTINLASETAMNAAIKDLKGNIYLAIGINSNSSITHLFDDITFTMRESFDPPPPPVPPPPPSPSAQGAVATGEYRNLFKELGKTDAEIDAKVEATWNRLFDGAEDQKIYYPVGNDMGYILDTGNNDIRSEGMSYGLMVCVQLDKQEEFDRLWKWARTYMYNTSKSDKNQRGYFAWQMGTDGSKKDASCAPDGDMYFVTALLFAENRWGNKSETAGDMFNYGWQARQVLHDMIRRDPGDSNHLDDYEAKSMFNLNEKMVVFVPYSTAATYTDPSYHLPAFYEVWALELEAGKSKYLSIWNGNQTELENDVAFWKDAADVSRRFFPKTTNGTTGLGPDYANWDGSPKVEGDHQYFMFDAWRIAMNIAMDYHWWAEDDWQKTFADRIQAFFYSKGVDSYGNQWQLNGTPVPNKTQDHSPGLVACNAVASLAATDSVAWEFVEDFWNSGMTSGQYRYYDGCLYMLGLLNVTGNYKAYLSSNTTITPGATINPTTASFDKYTSATISVNMDLNDNAFASIANGATTLTQGTQYTISGNTVTLTNAYLKTLPEGVTTLTFRFTPSTRTSTLTINVTDSTPGAELTPTSATFDKNAEGAEHQPIAVAMNLNGYTFTNIQNGATTLTQGSQYTVSGTTTINFPVTYLSTLAVGTTTLTFNFSGGPSRTFAITVKDTTPSALSSAYGVLEDGTNGFGTANATGYANIENLQVSFAANGTALNGNDKAYYVAGASLPAALYMGNGTGTPKTRPGAMRVEAATNNVIVYFKFDLAGKTLSQYSGISYEVAGANTSNKEFRVHNASGAQVSAGTTPLNTPAGNGASNAIQEQNRLGQQKRTFTLDSSFVDTDGSVKIGISMNSAAGSHFFITGIRLEP